MNLSLSCLKIRTFLRMSWWIWNFICSRFPKRGNGAGPGGSCLRFHCIPRNCTRSREAAKHTSTALTANISLLTYTVSFYLENCYTNRGQIHLSCSAGTSPRRKCSGFCSSLFITLLYLLIPENYVLLICTCGIAPLHYSHKSGKRWSFKGYQMQLIIRWDHGDKNPCPGYWFHQGPLARARKTNRAFWGCCTGRWGWGCDQAERGISSATACSRNKIDIFMSLFHKCRPAIKQLHWGAVCSFAAPLCRGDHKDSAAPLLLWHSPRSSTSSEPSWGMWHSGRSPSWLSCTLANLTYFRDHSEFLSCGIVLFSVSNHSHLWKQHYPKSSHEEEGASCDGSSCAGRTPQTEPLSFAGFLCKEHSGQFPGCLWLCIALTLEQNWTQGSRHGLTSAEQWGRITYLDLLATLWPLGHFASH